MSLNISKVWYFNSFKEFKLAASQSKDINFNRIYFGEEFCDERIPSKKEVEEIYLWCKKMGIDFTFITGIVTVKAFTKIQKILDLLSSKREKIEVVFSDWGIMNIIRKKRYTNLIPILGRLLVKRKIPVMYIDTKPKINLQLIPPEKSEIIWRKQVEVLRGTNLSVEDYRQFLKEKGINRIEIDPVPYGINLKKEWGFKFSLYFPFSYVTGGRICALAGLKQPYKIRYVNDEPCFKLCNNFYLRLFYKGGGNLYQIGNSIFLENRSFIGSFLKNKLFDRLVIQKFI